jgi:hypothetical protein
LTDPFKEDAGWKDYYLRLTATPRGEMTYLLAIGSPEWQLREFDSLKWPQNRRRGIQVKDCMRDPPKDRVATELPATN